MERARTCSSGAPRIWRCSTRFPGWVSRHPIDSLRYIWTRWPASRMSHLCRVEATAGHVRQKLRFRNRGRARLSVCRSMLVIECHTDRVRPASLHGEAGALRVALQRSSPDAETDEANHMSDMPDAIENSRATTAPVTSSRGAEYTPGHAPAGAAPAEAGGVEEGGKYVYCIIRQEHERSFGEIGIGCLRRVYSVHHSDLAAVVSDTPIVSYDPTRENVLAHEFVNETVMREFTVIPMSFGTVFRSESDVGELLRSTYDAFTDVLDKMQDKIEFGVQI